MGDNSNKGGMFKGSSHDDGGINFTIPETGKKIEVEGEEPLMSASSLQDPQVRERKGSNKEILTDINKKIGAKGMDSKATEVHAGDAIVCKRAANDETQKSVKGTDKQIVSAINTEAGCNVIESGGEITDSNGTKQFSDGGEADKRYIAESDYYVYAKDDKSAEHEARKISKELDKNYDNQAQVKHLTEHPFGTSYSRKIFNGGGSVEDINRLVKDLYKEHHEAWETMQRISDKVCEENCLECAKEIADIWESELKHHFEEEEKEFFPAIKNNLNKDIIADLIEEHKWFLSKVKMVEQEPTPELVKQFCSKLIGHIKQEEDLMGQIMPDPYKNNKETEEKFVKEVEVGKGYRVSKNHYSIPNKTVTVLDDYGIVVRVEYYWNHDFETDIIQTKYLTEIMENGGNLKLEETQGKTMVSPREKYIQIESDYNRLTEVYMDMEDLPSDNPEKKALADKINSLESEMNNFEGYKNGGFINSSKKDFMVVNSENKIIHEGTKAECEKFANTYLHEDVSVVDYWTLSDEEDYSYNSGGMVFKSKEELSGMTRLDVSKYSNALREKRNKSKNQNKKSEFQSQIDLADSFKPTFQEGGEADNTFNYMMLGRMQSDCDYFLGNGNGNEGQLHQLSVDAQIKEMKRLWNNLPEDGKPEWLSMNDILEYESKMKEKLNFKDGGNVDVPVAYEWYVVKHIKDGQVESEMHMYKSDAFDSFDKHKEDGHKPFIEGWKDQEGNDFTVIKSSPLWKEGDYLTVYVDDPELRVERVVESEGKEPVYTIISDDGKVRRNNISQSKITEAKSQYKDGGDVDELPKTTINYEPKTEAEFVKSLNDIDTFYVDMPRDKKSSYYGAVITVQEFYFKHTVSYNPTLIIGMFKAEKDLLKPSHRFGLNEVLDLDFMSESTIRFIDILKTSKIPVWKLIPEEFKKVPKVKQLSVQLTPNDENLGKIMDEFTGKDDLRPVMTGVYFDKELSNVVATDAHKMLVVYGEIKVSESEICLMGSNLKSQIKDDKSTLNKEEGDKFVEHQFKGGNCYSIDGKYPRYDAVIPKANTHIVSIKAFELYRFASILSKNKLINATTRIAALKSEDLMIGVNVNLLAIGLKAMMQLGHTELDITFSTPSRAMVIVPKGNTRKIGSDTDLALIMPAMLSSDDADGYEFVYDLDSKCIENRGLESLGCVDIDDDDEVTPVKTRKIEKGVIVKRKNNEGTVRYYVSGSNGDKLYLTEIGSMIEIEQPNRDFELVPVDEESEALKFYKEELEYQNSIPSLEEQREKFPIVMEWTEGSEERLDNKGYNSIEELEKELKTYGFREGEDTYIKNKIWVKGYKWDIQIPIGFGQGDYNPEKQTLLNWLENYDSNANFSQFSTIENDKKEQSEMESKLAAIEQEAVDKAQNDKDRILKEEAKEIEEIMKSFDDKPFIANVGSKNTGKSYLHSLNSFSVWNDRKKKMKVGDFIKARYIPTQIAVVLAIDNGRYTIGTIFKEDGEDYPSLKVHTFNTKADFDILHHATVPNHIFMAYEDLLKIDKHAPVFEVSQMDKFKVGTPVVYHSLGYNGEIKIQSGEIIMDGNKKAISLYSDANYSGSSSRIITPKNWFNVETFYENNQRKEKGEDFKLIKDNFKNGGGVKSVDEQYEHMTSIVEDYEKYWLESKTAKEKKERLVMLDDARMKKAMIKLKLKKNKSKAKKVHDFGCAMLYFNNPKLKQIHSEIEDKDIYIDDNDDSFGLEDESHTTLLYGLHEEVSDADVISTIRKHKFPNKIKLNNVSLFENDKYDVLKFDVVEPVLNKVNKNLTKFPHTTSFPDYHPHATIAYIKKGKGKKYVGKFKNMNIDVSPSEIVYSKTDGSKIIKKLK